MRSFTKLFAVTFLLVTVATMAQAASKTVIGVLADPAGANLQQYPLEPGPLTAVREATLKVHAVALTAPWTGYNYYRGLRSSGRWVLETLPTGTIVLADANGAPIYKADCGNRLVAVAQCPASGAGAGSGNGAGANGSGGKKLAGSDPSGPSFWARHPILGDFLDGLGALALGLLALLAFLLLLLLLLWLLRRLFEAMEEDYRRRNPPPPIQPVQPAAPAAPAATAPAAVPAAAPAVPQNAQQNQPDTAAPATPPADGTRQQQQPRYITFYRGEGNDPHKVKFAGHKEVRLTDHGDGSHTIHFR